MDVFPLERPTEVTGCLIQAGDRGGVAVPDVARSEISLSRPPWRPRPSRQAASLGAGTWSRHSAHISSRPSDLPVRSAVVVVVRAASSATVQASAVSWPDVPEQDEGPQRSVRCRGGSGGQQLRHARAGREQLAAVGVPGAAEQASSGSPGERRGPCPRAAVELTHLGAPEPRRWTWTSRDAHRRNSQARVDSSPRATGCGVRARGRRRGTQRGWTPVGTSTLVGVLW